MLRYDENVELSAYECARQHVTFPIWQWLTLAVVVGKHWLSSNCWLWLWILTIDRPSLHISAHWHAISMHQARWLTCDACVEGDDSEPVDIPFCWNLKHLILKAVQSQKTFQLKSRSHHTVFRTTNVFPGSTWAGWGLFGLQAIPLAESRFERRLRISSWRFWPGRSTNVALISGNLTAGILWGFIGRFLLASRDFSKNIMPCGVPA